MTRRAAQANGRGAAGGRASRPGAVGRGRRPAGQTDVGLRRGRHAAGMALARAWKQMSWFYYQYLLVTSLYMLEPWERTVFSILPGARARGRWGAQGRGGAPRAQGLGGGGRPRGARARSRGLASPLRPRGAEVRGPRAAFPRGPGVGGRELLRSLVVREPLDPREKRLYCWKKPPRAMSNLACPRLRFGRACLWFGLRFLWEAGTGKVEKIAPGLDAFDL